MKIKPILAACVAGLVLAAPVQAAAPVRPSLAARAAFFGYSTGFELRGTNGYRVGIFAFTERPDGKGEIFVGVGRDGRFKSGAFYRAPAIVSEDFLKADLGSLGRVDLALHPSGQVKTIDIKCSKQSYPFETGVYEGVVEFEGEDGYTRASATQIPFEPPVSSFCGGGSGKGESRGPGEKGARLQGVSFADGRRLTFQANKNHPRGRVPFSVELNERREGIQISRSIKGFAPAQTFHFDPNLQSAELRLPSPFSGSASLRRRSNSVTPSWSGDLSVDLAGHPNLRLAGPGVYVSLNHACFAYSGDPSSAQSC